MSSFMGQRLGSLGIFGVMEDGGWLSALGEVVVKPKCRLDWSGSHLGI